MKIKIISIVLVMCFIIPFAFTGCTEVSRTPIDTEYIAAYDAMETVYEYKFDAWNGDFVLLPVYKQVHHEDEYKVQYEIVWSDGSVEQRWVTVDKAKYEEAKKALAERSNQ